MPIKIIPRRSVAIEAWDATSDDLLRVTLSNEAIYHVRASASAHGQDPQFWFDLEFMPEDLRSAARSVARSELLRSSRERHGYSVSTPTYKPSEVEVDEELALRHNFYFLEELDYDIGLTVNMSYAVTELRKWRSGDRVAHIEWVTREQARVEVAPG